MALDEPKFLNTDAATIVAEMVAYYEGLVGFKLSPGQAEMLLIQAFAYREQLLRIQGNEAAKQNLLAFARYPMIDFLGELVGVKRLGASYAKCTISFALVSEHPALTIPKGIKVQSIDGKVVFETLADVAVLTTDETVSVDAVCTTEGTAGNGYAIGEISIILDPQAYVLSATNTNLPTGGADTETDDAVRERIKLAPSSFSCAGPEDAYVFFAKSANPSIIDVGIKSEVPGTVEVYPLLIGAALPSTAILNEVDAKLSPKNVRPLNDVVVVAAPTVVEYEIEAEITLLSGAIQTVVLAQIERNVAEYVTTRKEKLGRDAVRTQLISAMKIDGVYDVELIRPAANVTVDKNEVAVCTDTSISITGFSDE